MIIDPIATHGRARGRALACGDLATDRRWRWVEFDQAINRTAHWLIAQLGSGSGARVATLAKNCADLLILQLGCVRAGAIYVPLNWRLAAPEIAALIADSAPSLVFADDGLTVGGFDGDRYRPGDLSALTAGQPAIPPPDAARRGWDEATTLLYTSGTTGRPKGAMISEANVFFSCTNFMLGNQVGCDSVFLVDSPMFHTVGLFGASRTPLLAGGTVLISQGFDPAITLARIADPALGITHYFSVPQMAQMLWNAPEFRPEGMRGLKVFASGGGPNPQAQITRFVGAGIPMSDGFGMTETGSNSGMPVHDRELLLTKAGSIGLPYVAIEARIVDEDGREVVDGTAGELWLRGPSITKGYWNQPELTEKAFTDGWFRTGDVARRDSDGFYFLVDRKKDMFISGGENVYPVEIEAVIAELDDVAECAVIGIPDERWGEVGRAYVVAVEGRTVTEAAILAQCNARLARFKVPKSVIIGAAIPRTASGKVLKHVLRGGAD